MGCLRNESKADKEKHLGDFKEEQVWENRELRI